MTKTLTKSPRILAVLVPAAAVLALLAPSAGAAPLIGLAEQNPGAYRSPLFRAMGVTYGRVTIPWDAGIRSGFRRHEADATIRAMNAAGVEPVAVIGTRNSGRPTSRKYKKAVGFLVRRYPTVKYWAPWNEANLFAFTKRNPKMVAGWTKTLQGACRRSKQKCTVTSPTMLDETSIGSWSKRYFGYLRKSQRPRIWLMHNYMDANRFRVRNGKSFLKAARSRKAQVWIVETGGVIKGKGKNARRWKKGQTQQVKVFKWLTGKLARQYRVVKRIYIYQWRSPRKTNWDSGIVDPNGKPRKIYRTMLDYLKKNPER